MRELLRSFLMISLVLLVGITIAGCSLSFEKAGKKVDTVIEERVDTEKIEKKVEEVKEKGKSKFDELVRDLEDFEMEKIDDWVEKNNLNEYGDKIDTIYEKGSPLIEEAGKIRDKYEYIIENNPDLIDELKLKVE